MTITRIIITLNETRSYRLNKPLSYRLLNQMKTQLPFELGFFKQIPSSLSSSFFKSGIMEWKWKPSDGFSENWGFVLATSRLKRNRIWSYRIKFTCLHKAAFLWGLHSIAAFLTRCQRRWRCRRCRWCRKWHFGLFIVWSRRVQLNKIFVIFFMFVSDLTLQITHSIS